MEKVHGYIEIDPNVIVRACTDFLNDRDQKQEKAKSEYIKYQMSRRFFPAKTEKEAEKRAWDMGFCCYRIQGEYWADMVRSIKQQAKTASITGARIIISNDIHDCISPFFKWNDQ